MSPEEEQEAHAGEDACHTEARSFELQISPHNSAQQKQGGERGDPLGDALKTGWLQAHNPLRGESVGFDERGDIRLDA